MMIVLIIIATVVFLFIMIYVFHCQWVIDSWHYHDYKASLLGKIHLCPSNSCLLSTRSEEKQLPCQCVFKTNTGSYTIICYYHILSYTIIYYHILSYTLHFHPFHPFHQNLDEPNILFKVTPPGPRASASFLGQLPWKSLRAGPTCRGAFSMGPMWGLLLFLGDHEHGGFWKWGISQIHPNSWFIRENPIYKWMTGGVPLWLRKAPCRYLGHEAVSTTSQLAESNPFFDHGRALKHVETL